MRRPVARSRSKGRDSDACPYDDRRCSVGWDDADDRVAEIAEILAAGLMRVCARKSSQKYADFGESSLALSRRQSGHADPDSPEDQA